MQQGKLAAMVNSVDLQELGEGHVREGGVGGTRCGTIVCHQTDHRTVPVGFTIDRGNVASLLRKLI